MGCSRHLVLLALCLSASVAVGLRVSPSERLHESSLDQLPVASKQPAGLQGPEGQVPIVDPPTRVAGYFDLDRTKAAKMFYFYFQARRNPTNSPVVLWMTGGPGCSSELAVLYENGPYALDGTGKSLEERQYGWDATHNMIFVDQPIGTGFSYSDDDADTVYNEQGVADDMLDFLQNFFAAHPELAGLPLYITGESYAGHYVPAVSHRVWLANKNKEGPYINFKGLAVGNGLTEPTIQFNAYGDFAVSNNLISPMMRTWMGLLFPLCRLANSWCESTNWDFVCALGQQYCMVTQFQPILAANPDINVYDITRKCDGRLCYDFTAADEFLNSAAVRKALGVGNREWVSCAPDVYMNFAGDWLHRYDTVLPDMMADGIRVMIYAGDLDLICNHVGNRRWVDALEWQGSEAWGKTGDIEWVVQGRQAGKVKEVGPLSFVQVYKAGHMVPMDQPLNSLAMITAWTRNMSLVHSPHRKAEPVAPQSMAVQDAAMQPLIMSNTGSGSGHMKGKASTDDLPVWPQIGGHAMRASDFMRSVADSVAAKAAGAARTAMERAGAVARKLKADPA